MDSTTVIPYGKQYIDDADIAAVTEALQSDFLTQGPGIAAFEEAFAAQVGAKYCVAVNSGTAALHAAYFACGLGAGDEIITTPLTFAATSNAALYLGAKVLFADVEINTGNLDPKKVARLLSPQTKLIVPVHYAGQPAALKEFKNLAEKHNLRIIEDACHALGATYGGTPIGSCEFSDATVFSFHPVKHITTGEGGAVTTNDPELYQQLLLFRTHGITKDPSLLKDSTQGAWYYEMQALGFNYRITDVQAALGLSQLKKLPKFIARRREIAERYAAAFAHSEYFEIPQQVPLTEHGYHLYPIRLKPRFAKHRKQLFAALQNAKLGVQVHYVPVYQHPYYQSIGYSGTNCPNAEAWYQSEISIPMYPGLTNAEQDTVIERILKVFHEWHT